MSAAAAALGGCQSTLSGWHVVRVDRRYLLLPGAEEVVRELELLGVRCEYVDRYGWNDRPEKPTCLCGWHLTEDAVLVLERQWREVVRGAGILRAALEGRIERVS